MPTEAELISAGFSHDFQTLQVLRPLYLNLDPQQALIFLSYKPAYIYQSHAPVQVNDPGNYEQNNKCLASLFEESKDGHALVSISLEIRHLFDTAQSQAEAKQRQWEIAYAEVRKLKEELKVANEQVILLENERSARDKQLKEIAQDLTELKRLLIEQKRLHDQVSTRTTPSMDNTNGLLPSPASQLHLRSIPSSQSVPTH